MKEELLPWLLCDALTIEQAAYLICDVDPTSEEPKPIPVQTWEDLLRKANYEAELCLSPGEIKPCHGITFYAKITQGRRRLDSEHIPLSPKKVKAWLESIGHTTGFFFCEKGTIAPIANKELSDLKASPKAKGGKPKSRFTEAIEAAYLHFMKKGDTEILKPERRADFVRSLMALVTNEDWSKKGNENISGYISERIKGQKRKNSCIFIETQERQVKAGKNTIKTIAARDYTLGELSKVLCKLRKDYPLPL